MNMMEQITPADKRRVRKHLKANRVEKETKTKVEQYQPQIVTDDKADKVTEDAYKTLFVGRLVRTLQC
jgi:NADH dehydrogenase FAD-containing subunit